MEKTDIVVLGGGVIEEVGGALKFLEGIRIKINSQDKDNVKIILFEDRMLSYRQKIRHH